MREGTGIVPEWTRRGLLMWGGDEQPEAFDWAARFGYGGESLEGEAVNRCEPALGSPPGQALWMPEVAQVRNPRLLKAVRQGLADLGVEVEPFCQVRRLLREGGHVAGVDTEGGERYAPAVVVCAGAWSARLLQGLGVTPEITPVRGQMLMFRAAPGTVRRIVLDGNRYVIPRRDGRVLVGSTMEEVGFDASITAAARDELCERALSLIPALAKASIERHWSGLRPSSPAGIPYIGPHPQVEGLYLNAGHFRNGVVTAPASARLLADLALGREPVLDPGAYALETDRTP